MILNRRRFLISAAAPCLLRSAPVAANEGPGILAIGVGNRGGAVALAAARHARVVACCDVDTAKAEAFLARLAKEQPSRPELYKDYGRALERKDVDAVTIGTPDHWHTAIVIAALKAGKDVYCEKPMTLTIDEGRKICQAVRKTRRVVQVGTQQRSEFNGRFLKAVALARGGRLGKPLTAACFIGAARAAGPFPVNDPPGTLDWDFWLGQAPKAPYSKERCHGTFRWWYEYSGGKLTDWGAHHVDIAMWALGEENTGPVEIEGQGDFPLGRAATLAMLRGRGARDFPNAYNTATKFKITLKFGSGNTITVEDGPGNGIRLEGDKEQIWVSRSELKGRLVEAIAGDAGETERLAAEVAKLYGGPPATHMANFMASIRSRSTPISDVFTHHRAVSACHLCNIAMLMGRKLRWDPKKESFIGDGEANALVARKQRKPYRIEA